MLSKIQETLDRVENSLSEGFNPDAFSTKKGMGRDEFVSHANKYFKSIRWKKEGKLGWSKISNGQKHLITLGLDKVKHEIKDDIFGGKYRLAYQGQYKDLWFDHGALEGMKRV